MGERAGKRESSRDRERAGRERAGESERKMETDREKERARVEEGESSKGR